MTPLILQQKLAAKIAQLTANTREQDSPDTVTPLKVYLQNLPEKEKVEDKKYSYALVRLDEGEQESESSYEDVKLMVIVGVHYDAPDHHGHAPVAQVLQKIKAGLIRNPVIEGMFELSYPVRWGLHDEDTFPYYFGAIELHFEIATAQREDVEELI